MKLRIHKDSIRLRVSKGEVETLLGGNTLQETVAMGPTPAQAFTYRVVPERNAIEGDAMRADLDGNLLTIAVPFETIQHWRNGVEPGLEAQQVWPGGAVRILLEKDLQRLNPKDGEEAGDVYPNPLFGKVRCDHP